MERTLVGYDRLRDYMAEMLKAGLGYPDATARVASEALVRPTPAGTPRTGWRG